VCSGRGDEPTPTGAPLRLTDELRCGPLAPSRTQRRDAEFLEHLDRRQVGDVVNVDRKAPHDAWQSRLRRDAELRGVAVPLGPRGRLAVCEVQRPNDSAALPASVSGLQCQLEGVATRP
jgi:hypothetical protein